MNSAVQLFTALKGGVDRDNPTLNKAAATVLLLLMLHPFAAGNPPNILLICVDDLRPELACYGVDYIHSPNMDALATEGRLFQRHYVQAPTCGASRYALLTGTYGPAGNKALLNRAKNIAKNPESESSTMPGWFRKHGYRTIAVGKVSHYPGGLSGDDWDDPTQPEMPLSWDRSLMPAGPWQHPRGAMHGLANGEIRHEPSQMDVYQSTDGPDTAYPDGLITETALQEMEQLAHDEKPFFLAVGLIKPHLPFGAPAKYMEHYSTAELPVITPVKPEGKTTWHESREFMMYNRWGRNPNEDPEFAIEVRRHYAACVSYADAQVGQLLAQLEELKLDGNTIVVLWGDHGWHLGEHAIWGKHSLFEESLHAPLIIRQPGIPVPGQTTDAIVETIDLFPTLCELARLPDPQGLDGRSLVAQITEPQSDGHNAISYTASEVTIRTDTHRLVVHEDGYTELYSHLSPEKESRNVAVEHTDLVKHLVKLLHEKSPEKLPESLMTKVIDKSEQEAGSRKPL